MIRRSYHEPFSLCTQNSLTEICIEHCAFDEFSHMSVEHSERPKFNFSEFVLCYRGTMTR